MPMVQLTHVKGALSDAQKEQLSERMTQVLLMIEGEADTPGGRSIAWVLFNEVEPTTWAVGGRFDGTYVAAAGKFLVFVTVPEGSMSQPKKSAVHKAVNDAILEVTGTADTPGGGRSAWVIINEVTEGHWGAGGKTFSIAQIARIAGVPLDGDLFGYVRDYFGAKRRVFEGAGYPADTAGIMRMPAELGNAAKPAA
jgi:phenylpyruvate tautomerase PptA (4-oxalocrotonate tautomerase family)